jgi:hypothetical protein
MLAVNHNIEIAPTCSEMLLAINFHSAIALLSNRSSIKHHLLLPWFQLCHWEIAFSSSTGNRPAELQTRPSSVVPS